MSEFRVLNRPAVESVLSSLEATLVHIIEQAYLTHSDGRTVNPDSYFLRFPSASDNRIIALPAAILDDEPVAGIKWISSFPHNIERGIERASAVIVLNDMTTGQPLALMEGAHISATRTAYSAALALRHLLQKSTSGFSLGIIGAGHIASSVVKALVTSDLSPDNMAIYDLDERRSKLLARKIESEFALPARPANSYQNVFAQDVVLLATTAGTPYLHGLELIHPGQIVLNISLRDLSPEIIVQHWNIVDDVEHCLKAKTSPHLAETLTGNRSFLSGTLPDLINREIEPDRSKGLIFSPFGLGILDLALARIVYATSEKQNLGVAISDFSKSHMSGNLA